MANKFFHKPKAFIHRVWIRPKDVGIIVALTLSVIVFVFIRSNPKLTKVRPPSLVTTTSTTYYVKNGGSNFKDGRSWSTAWATIEYALGTPSASGKITDGDYVVVRAGTYHPNPSILLKRHHITLVSERRAVSLGLFPRDAGYLDANPIIDGSNCSGTSTNTIYADVSSGSPDVSYFTIDGFTIQHPQQTSIRMLATGHRDNADHLTIRYCEFVHHDSGAAMYVRQGDDILIQECTFHDFTGYGDAGGGHLGHGVYLMECDDAVVENCRFYDFKNSEGGHQAIHLNSGDATPEIPNYRNTVRSCEFHGLRGSATYAVDFMNSDSGVFENNLIYDVDATQHVRAVIRQSGEWGARKVVIKNNTFIMGASLNSAILLGANGTSSDCVVFNNLIINKSGASSSAISYTSSDNHTITGNRVRVYNTADLSNWFVNPSAGDYHLKAGSPFENAGIAFATNSVAGIEYAPAVAFDGSARPQGTAYDVGAFERLSPGGDIQTGIDAYHAPAFSLLAPYPNPASLNVSVPFVLPEQAPARVDIYDVSGRRVKEVFSGVGVPGSNVVNVSVRDMPPGVYFVRLEYKGSVASQKVVVTR